MKNGAKRELVRERTAYAVGRMLTDVLLIVELVVLVGLTILYSLELGFDASGSVLVAPLATTLAVALVCLVAAILQRELLHALFDVADHAIGGVTLPETERISLESSARAGAGGLPSHATQILRREN